MKEELNVTLPSRNPAPRTLRLMEALGLSLIDLAERTIAFESRISYTQGSSCMTLPRSQFKAASSAWLQVEDSVTIDNGNCCLKCRKLSKGNDKWIDYNCHCFACRQCFARIDLEAYTRLVHTWMTQWQMNQGDLISFEPPIILRRSVNSQMLSEPVCFLHLYSLSIQFSEESELERAWFPW